MKTFTLREINLLYRFLPTRFHNIVTTMLIFFYIISTLFSNLYAYKVTVKINEGAIVGVKQMTVFNQKEYFAFYGVPYAKPPIGRLRFQNPKPLKKFNKPFDATMQYHSACAQAHIFQKQALYGQEDCLHLNIFTPYLPEKEHEHLKPVIMWIHGYAFSMSFSHVFGPDFLIENDIIFISLTHRIGVFGFLKLNQSNTNVNMGLKDIIIGLKWIRRNIEYFGGDKNKITLMGSGSGGTFVSLLFLTKYRKLFQKLIIQSGSMFSSVFHGLNYLELNKLEKEIKKVGYNDYKTAPAHVLVSASKNIYSYQDVINSQRPLVPFLPLIENESSKSLLTALDFHKYEDNENSNYDMPILTGFTTQESISEVIPFIHNPSYLKSFGKYFKYYVPFSNGCKYNYTTNTYTSIGNEIIQKYFKNYPNITLDTFLKYTSDVHIYPIYKFIKTHIVHSKSNLFVYKFNYNGKFNIMKSTSLARLNITVKGTAHGDELCYILKCAPLLEEYIKIKDDIYNRDRMFMKEIATMWANFAKFGNPTPPSHNLNITWSPMTSKEDKLLFFGKTRNRIIDSSSEAKMYAFWNKIYHDYYSPKHCNNVHDEL